MLAVSSLEDHPESSELVNVGGSSVSETGRPAILQAFEIDSDSATSLWSAATLISEIALRNLWFSSSRARIVSICLCLNAL